MCIRDSVYSLRFHFPSEYAGIRGLPHNRLPYGHNAVTRLAGTVLGLIDSWYTDLSTGFDSVFSKVIVITVSYTHLDVYKRQQQGFSVENPVESCSGESVIGEQNFCHFLKPEPLSLIHI